MGKMKGTLEENMARYPELYNGGADYEFWIECRKKKNKPAVKEIKCQKKKK